MKTVTLFHFESCPYCQETYRWIDEALREHPEFRGIPIKRVDEKKQPDIAEQYDYWYVPTFYIGDQKVHEGACSKQIVLDVLTRAKNADA